MAEAKAQGEIPAPIDEVWKVVSDFIGFVTLNGMDVIAAGEGLGMTRTVSFGSAEMVERLESLDESNYTTSYSIVSGPLPANDYLGTMKLTPSSDSTTTLDWSGSFEPVGDPAQAVAIFERVYAGGIETLQKHFRPGAVPRSGAQNDSASPSTDSGTGRR